MYLRPFEPGLALILNEVEVFYQQRRQECRVIECLGDVFPERFQRLDCSKSGIRLNPALLVFPFLALVKLKNESDEMLGFFSRCFAVQPFGSVFVLSIENATAHESVGRDLKNQRLPTGGNTLNRQVVEVAVCMAASSSTIAPEMSKPSRWFVLAESALIDPC